MKHASPAAQKPHRTPSSDVGDVGSMPSLASEISPGTGKSSDESSNISIVDVGAKLHEPTSSEKTAVNALLMAAMAMTEMSANPVATTPPKVDGVKSDNGDQYETPPKRFVDKFTSPKRKQSPTDNGAKVIAGAMRKEAVSDDSSPSNIDDSDDAEDDSPKREPPGDVTPSVNHKVKRSRIGSTRKIPRNLGDEMSKDRNDTKLAARPFAFSEECAETPNVKTKGKIAELTPVSARCIDFRKMHVNEPLNNGEHAPTG